MVTPAAHLWNTLIVQISTGGNNLVQLLGQQGYELVQEWQGQDEWQALNQKVMNLAVLDLTRTSQAGMVFFLEMMRHLQSALVVVHDCPALPLGDTPGPGGHGYVLKKPAQRVAPAAVPTGVTSETARLSGGPTGP